MKDLGKCLLCNNQICYRSLGGPIEGYELPSGLICDDCCRKIAHWILDR